MSSNNEWKCPRCGLTLDRASAWDMSLVDFHYDRHIELEKNKHNKEDK